MAELAKGKLTLRRRIIDFLLRKRTIIFKDDNKYIVCEYNRNSYLGRLDKESVICRLIFMIHVHELGVLIGRIGRVRSD